MTTGDELAKDLQLFLRLKNQVILMDRDLAITVLIPYLNKLYEKADLFEPKNKADDALVLMCKTAVALPIGIDGFQFSLCECLECIESQDPRLGVQLTLAGFTLFGRSNDVKAAVEEAILCTMMVSLTAMMFAKVN